jgi:hypothetical protein
MESRAGGEIKSYRANQTLFFAANGWLYLLMVAFGTVAGGTAECRNQGAIFGFLKSKGIKRVTVRLTACYERPGGKSCAFGSMS